MQGHSRDFWLRSSVISAQCMAQGKQWPLAASVGATVFHYRIDTAQHPYVHSCVHPSNHYSYARLIGPLKNPFTRFRTQQIDASHASFISEKRICFRSDRGK